MGDAEEISHATILIFAHHLGIDIDAEEHLMFIAKEALQQMPEGWELGVSPEGDENAGIPYFFMIESGESVWEHPNDAMYKERVKEERNKRAAALAERKKAKLAKDGSPKGISGRKGSLVSERAGAFEKGAIKGDGTGEGSPLDTATAVPTNNPIASTNVKVPLASAMAFVNSGGKTNKNISPVKQHQQQLHQSSTSEETTIATTMAKAAEAAAVTVAPAVNTTSTTSVAPVPSVVVDPTTTTTPEPPISLSVSTAAATATITATTTTTTAPSTVVGAPVVQPALVPVASTTTVQGPGQGLGKGQKLEVSTTFSAFTHIQPSASSTVSTINVSHTQPTPTPTPSSSSLSVHSLAASASPQYGLLSVVIDGAKLHSKYKPGYSMQCSIVVTNNNDDTSDSTGYNNYSSSGKNTSSDRVLAIFKPAFTGSSKLHRYVQGKSQARPGLAPALVSVQRETPVVPLEPLSAAQEDSPQHPHHRSTLLADIASAGGKPLSRHHGYSSQCSWGEVVQIKCCAGWKLQLRVTLSPPPPPAGNAINNNEQVLLLLAKPIVVGGESNSKWEEHPLKIATPTSSSSSISRGLTAFGSSNNNDGLVELWAEFVPLTRTLWRRGPGLGSGNGQGLGSVRGGALSDVRKTLAEVEFEAYQDYEASLVLLQGLIVDLQTSATANNNSNQSSSSSQSLEASGSGGGATAHKGIWATVSPARIGPGPRQTLVQAAKALEYLGSHSTEDLGLTNRLLAILQPQHSKAMAMMMYGSSNANINASSPTASMPLPPSTVPLAAARSVLRSFVAATVSDLVVEAPALGGNAENSSSISSHDNEALLEQLVSLFLSTQLTHQQTTTSSSSSSSSVPPVATSLTWRQLMALCFTSAVWTIETACVAAALISDPQVGVSLTELRAVRHKWWSFDHHLTGTLSSVELKSLLFAMGGVEYTAEEVRIALLELDPDDLKLVEFASFIRWWGLPPPQLQQ